MPKTNVMAEILAPEAPTTNTTLEGGNNPRKTPWGWIIVAVIASLLVFLGFLYFQPKAEYKFDVIDDTIVYHPRSYDRLTREDRADDPAPFLAKANAACATGDFWETFDNVVEGLKAIRVALAKEHGNSIDPKDFAREVEDFFCKLECSQKVSELAYEIQTLKNRELFKKWSQQGLNVRRLIFRMITQLGNHAEAANFRELRDLPEPDCLKSKPAKKK